MRKTVMGILVLAVVIAACACGCHSTGGGNGGSPDEKVVIGFPMTMLDDQHWVEYLLLVEQAAKALDVEIVVTDADQKDEKQLADVESLIAQGVDGIVICPLSAELGPTLLGTIDAAGIPVIAVDTYPGVEVGHFDNYIAFIGLDDEMAGYQTAKHLIEMGARKFVGLDGLPGLSTSEARTRGLKKAVEESDGVTLYDTQYTYWRLSTGQELMEDWLIAYPDIDAVWAAGTDPLLGAIPALQSAGIDPATFYMGGLDTTEPALEALQDGMFSIVAGGHWAQGAYALVMLYDYLHGFETDAPDTGMELQYYTTDTVKDYIDLVQKPLHAEQALFDWKNFSKTFNPDAKHKDMIVSPSPDNVITSR